MDAPARLVILFSGHMIDAPGRTRPRFPPDQEETAARAIQATLDTLHAGPEDLAICGAACGGDLLFAEAALSRGLRLILALPFDESEFMQQSVDFAGAHWREHFFAVSRAPRTTVRVATAVLGPLPAGEDAFERNNRWMLDTARQHRGGGIHYICLWNGERGDGPGGVAHLAELVRGIGGTVHWLDTRKLWDPT